MSINVCGPHKRPIPWNAGGIRPTLNLWNSEVYFRIAPDAAARTQGITKPTIDPTTDAARTGRLWMNPGDSNI
jgi:hypothetical protein